MLETSYQKQERARRRHKQRMEAIYSRRDDICLNCAFFKDGRFCVNPHHAEGNCWADSNHVVGSIMVTATQGCELFERRREIEIRDADPEERAERDRYERERRAISDGSAEKAKAARRQLETAAQNKFGPIRNIRELDNDTIKRMAGGGLDKPT